ncbi:MAG TPA: serine/threonine-protein kinase [Polyangiaceae bacterium]|nr:serine/threonine-protein kinase [Polyangiaceae bacterium]
MLPSQPTLEIPFADDDDDAGLTPVVPTFTGLASQSVPHELFEALERYKLVARLGHGGMAEVFLAAWEVAPFVHRPVVIKRLHEHFTEDQNLVQMFLDEARLLCLLEHPHIVKTLEAGVIEGRCCIAMEYLEGQPLHRVLRRAYQRGKLPIELAVSIACSMLAALDYAHDAKDASGQALEIVHRDVSPHNVFVCNDGQVKVLDFGIAKAKTQEGRTATGMVKGKVGYIAPEQAAAEAVDRRADVWSAGVVLWEALAGTRLFKAETDAATLNLTLKGEIPTAATRRTELPVELDVILARALQRIPGLRYRSAGAMQKDLESWLEKAGHSRDQQALAGLMRELFASEIIEQRRLVSVLMARSDCTPPNPSSVRTPSSTSALIVSSASPTSADLTNVNDRVDELNHRHKRAYRSLFALLALFAGFACGVAYFVALKLNPSAAAAQATVGMPHAAAPELRKASASGATEPSSAPVAQPLATVAAVPKRTTAGAPPALRALAARPGPAPSAPPAALEPATVNAVAHPEPSANFGFLTIDTSPWSLVSVGGKVLGQTPLVGVKLPSGTQVLSLRNPELGIETSYSVTIEPGKTSARRIGIE